MFDTPVSEASAKSTVGVAIPVSTATVMFAELTFPAVSVVVTVKVLLPSGSCDVVIEYVPSSPTVAVPTSAPLASVITTVAPTSPVPLIVGVLSLVILSVFEPPVSEASAKSTVGATIPVSTATVMFAELEFPAVSVVVTVRVLSPSGNTDVVIE